MMQNVEKILLLRPDGIGDALNSTPAIHALRETYPDAHIAIILKPAGAEILVNNPNIDEIIIYDPEGLKDILHFLKHLRGSSYDMVLVLRDASHCNFMAYISGARYRLGRNTKRKRFRSRLTHRVETRYPKGTRHEADRVMDVVRLAGAEDVDRRLALYLSDEEKSEAQKFLRHHGLEGSPLLGIHPGGSTTDKLWPAGNFARTADRLAEEFGMKIIIFAVPSEEHLLREIQADLSYPAVSAVGLSLRQSAALIGRCSLFLCNDSGPMHIAAALEVPTVAVFGPTDHVRWRPLNENAVVIRQDLGCWPCNTRRCRKQFECVRSLPVSDVIEAGIRILNTQ